VRRWVRQDVNLSEACMSLEQSEGAEKGRWGLSMILSGPDLLLGLVPGQKAGEAMRVGWVGQAFESAWGRMIYALVT
jgi:hypothetical protein